MGDSGQYDLDNRSKNSLIVKTYSCIVFKTIGDGIQQTRL